MENDDTDDKVHNTTAAIEAHHATLDAHNITHTTPPLSSSASREDPTPQPAASASASPPPVQQPPRP